MADATPLREYPINFLLAGLFIISLIAFAVGLAHNYGETDALMKSNKIDFSRIENLVNSTAEDSQAWGNSFKSDNPFVATGAIIMFSLWGIAKLIWNSSISMLMFFLDGASALLGLPPIVTGTILAIATISMIFGIWRLFQGGD